MQHYSMTELEFSALEDERDQLGLIVSLTTDNLSRNLTLPTAELLAFIHARHEAICKALSAVADRHELELKQSREFSAALAEQLQTQSAPKAKQRKRERLTA